MFQSPQRLLNTTLQFVSWCGVSSNLQYDILPIYRKIVVVLQVVFPMCSMIYSICHSYQDLKDITAFIMVTGTLLEWINYVVTVISPLYTARSMLKFFVAVEHAQRSLSCLDIAQSDVPSQFLQSVFIVFGGVLPIMISVTTRAVYTSLPMFYFILSYTALIVTVCATLIKIKMMLTLVTNKFQVLNCYLKQVSNEIKKHKCLSAQNCDQPIKLTCKSVCGDRPNESSSFMLSVDKISILNAAHFHLCDAHTVINDVFSVSGLTMSLTISFVCLRAFIMYEFVPFYIMMFSNSFIIMLLFIFMLIQATDAKINVSTLKDSKCNHFILIQILLLPKPAS